VAAEQPTPPDWEVRLDDNATPGDGCGALAELLLSLVERDHVAGEQPVCTAPRERQPKKARA
jgi:hypothetical protein